MYKTNDKKRKFLTDCGFVLNGKLGEESVCGFTGVTHSMELWELIGINHIRLYIHFDNTEDANYCNLYEGENERDVQYFAERNLISQMRKRGYSDKIKTKGWLI